MAHDGLSKKHTNAFSRLWIDAADFCSKDGIHSTQRGEGKSTLDVGEHAPNVAYFERGQQELHVGLWTEWQQ